MTEKNYTTIHTVVKEMKNSTRKTTYSVTTFNEEERPTPTVQLKIQTEWIRKDGAGGPEKPEFYEIPAIQLIHTIQERGEKKTNEQ